MDRIRFVEVSKRFSRRKGAKLLANWGFWRKEVTGPRWFNALDHVSFTLSGEGKRLGIIGSNGSGKTTLLRIIAGVTNPTSGSVTINGRVLPLLELFSGLQPDLTGRENIYLNGLILGMRREEIHRKLDSIVDFSGVEKFIDMPLKHYSIGMTMRLSFGVATHVEGKIILVDEAWGIGDAEFQAKSFERLQQLRHQGATLILVSHDPNILVHLADEIAWLDQGKIRLWGPPKEVIEAYLKTHRTD